MAKSQQQVDIAITARDESASVFKSALQNARELNMEARRSGDQALERILKGGGALGLAVFAMEGLGKAAEGTREAIKGVADGTMTIGEGIGHALEKGVDAIPLFGKLVQAFTGVEDAAYDTSSAIAKYFNAPEWLSTWLKSNATVKQEGEIATKAAEAGIEAVTKARNRAALAGLEGVAKEREAARQAFEEEQKQTEEKQKKAETGVDPGNRRQIDKAFNQARQIEKEEYDRKIAELDKKEQRDREADQAAHVARVHDIMGQAREADLQSQGKHLEAKLAQLQRENDKALAEIDRRAEEERRKRPQDGNKINAQAEEERLAQSKALEDEQHRARQDEEKRLLKERNEKADKQAQLDHDLSGARLSSLQEEAKLGNAAAGEAARKLEIEMKYQEHKQQLLKMLREEKDLTASQVAEINKAITDDAKARDEAIARPKVERVEEHKADLEESSRLQGIKDNAENPLIRIAQEHRDEAKTQTDILNIIMANTAPETSNDTPQSVFGN